MSCAAAEILEFAIASYFMAGIAFVLVFLRYGLVRLDPAASGAPLLMRMLIVPGCVAFWPLLAMRWRRETRSHS